MSAGLLASFLLAFTFAGFAQDITPPSFVSALLNCDRTIITVTFSEPIFNAYLQDVFNYAIDDPDDFIYGAVVADPYSEASLSVDLLLGFPLSLGMHTLSIPPGSSLLAVSFNSIPEGAQIPITPADVEPPSVSCTPAPNCGKDAFQLQAYDNCDGSNLNIFIRDSCDGPCGDPGFQAGPYAPGTTVRLAKSRCPNGARFVKQLGTPCGSTVVAAQIVTRGNPLLVVTDSAGNTTCQVWPFQSKE
jgi:hypothetical protein